MGPVQACSRHARLTRSRLARRPRRLRWIKAKSAAGADSQLGNGAIDHTGTPMSIRLLGTVLTLCASLGAWAQSPAQNAPRGELLYTTHCVACHDSQMHWRDQRSVQDWPSLTAAVRRWQDQARLQWREEDITAVAHYLNRRYYRLPDVPARVATVTGVTPVAHAPQAPVPSARRWP